MRNTSSNAYSHSLHPLEPREAANFTCSSRTLIATARRLSFNRKSKPSQMSSQLTCSTPLPALLLWLSFSNTRSLCLSAIVPFLDGDTLGNNLADYVDGGGIVVQYGFSHLRARPTVRSQRPMGKRQLQSVRLLDEPRNSMHSHWAPITPGTR